MKGQAMQFLADLSKGLGPLQWFNEPAKWEPLPGGGIRVYAPARTDYFQNPNGQGGVDSAPLLWTTVEGDFVAQAHVRPTFASTYDAGALMVRHDETHWAKLCFESTDLGTHAAVSVVTDGLSDDANGVDLETGDIRLQVVRQGDLFGMHYALEGEPGDSRAWRMVRYFALSLPPQVKVGLVAQCPVGSGTVVDFYSFTIESRRVENVRAGV
jgi:regulation of enolase protein 1 (concanavalin A-like superfamily)